MKPQSESLQQTVSQFLCQYLNTIQINSVEFSNHVRLTLFECRKGSYRGCLDDDRSWFSPGSVGVWAGRIHTGRIKLTIRMNKQALVTKFAVWKCSMDKGNIKRVKINESIFRDNRKSLGEQVICRKNYNLIYF